MIMDLGWCDGTGEAGGALGARCGALSGVFASPAAGCPWITRSESNHWAEGSSGLGADDGDWVQAPRWIWSPGRRGTGLPEGTSLPLTWMPLVEPRSMTDQVPSGAANSSACRRETPGSGGGPVRSISGWMREEPLRRPMRTGAGQRGSGARRRTTGKLIDAASASSAARTLVVVGAVGGHHRGPGRRSRPALPERGLLGRSSRARTAAAPAGLAAGAAPGMVGSWSGALLAGARGRRDGTRAGAWRGCGS